MLKTKLKIEKMEKRNRQSDRQSGYTFLEILIVVIVIASALTAIAINISSGLATMTPEESLVQTANVILEAKSQALVGINDNNKRTFTLESVPKRNGVTITTLPNNYGKGCESALVKDNSFGDQQGQDVQQAQSKYSFCVLQWVE